MDYRLTLWPRQAEAFESSATEILFGGATRGGKSHFLRVSLIIWCLQIPKLQCILIRKKYDDILSNHVYGENGFQDLLSPLIEAGKVVVTQHAITFNNGSRIAFKHCQDERQFETAQGIPSNVLAIDEATQISERLLRTFRAWCTMTQEAKAALPPEWQGKFPRIYYFANPIGTSVGFFRRHFIKARPKGAIEQVDGFKRQFIEALVTDNPSEDPEATRGRVQGMYDAAVAKALLEGDWDAPVGEFFQEWDEERHVLPDFIPPAHWYRFRTFDWGTAEPFAVLWWAVADGDQFNADIWEYESGTLVKHSRRLWLPRGSLVGYREWYGANPEKPSEGLRMSNEDMAKGIIERSPSPNEQGLQTLTDSYPFGFRGEADGKNIAWTFGNCGVPLTLGRTSRVEGWSQMRSRLIGVQIDSNSPKRMATLFVTQSCKAAREYIPALTRHPNEAKKEDAQESGEATHICDTIRLACMAFEQIGKLPPQPLDPRDLRNDITGDDVMKMLKRQNSNGSRY